MRINEADLAAVRPEPNSWISTRQMKGDWFTPSDEEFSELSQHLGGLAEYNGGIALVLAYTMNVPPLSSLDWRAFSHQSGGMSCSSRHYIGFELMPKAEVEFQLKELARYYFYYRTGHFYAGEVRMSDLVDYNDRLKKLGLSCETSYHKLEEAIYPIDATRDNVQRLIGDEQKPPIIHGGLKEYPNSGGTIFLLAQNSD